MHKYPVTILGASGYAGRELVALVSRHPHLSLQAAAANGQAGQTALIGGRDVTFVHADDVKLEDAALVFSALPHGASSDWIARAHTAGARAVDLSSDLRPGNGHGIPDLPAPYGLTEYARTAVKDATVVANPGCYPTAILLSLLPLFEQGLVLPGGAINIVAASGVTGAGFSPRTDLLFGEISEDYRAYGVGNEHRHLNEMRAMLGNLGADNDLLFTPHLLPVARGILATITVPLVRPIEGDVMAPWRARFAGEPFIEIASSAPALRDVVRRNVVRIWATPAAHMRTPTLIVIAAIDNLVKGAAGQALQNANLLLGLEETAGLPQ